MGSTYVRFRAQGFEASDAALEVWLLLLVQAIDALPDRPDWLEAAREDWYTQATEAFGFGVLPELDAIVTSPERRDLVLSLCETALNRLQTDGPSIPKAALNRLVAAKPGYEFRQDVGTRVFARTGEYFVRLLRETLEPDQRDARFGD